MVIKIGLIGYSEKMVILILLAQLLMDFILISLILNGR